MTDESPGLYLDLREQINASRKKVLNWEFDSPNGTVSIKTKLIGANMYLSTFFYGGNRFAVLQGHDVDLKNHWHEHSRKQVERFLDFYGKSEQAA